ncbi:polyphosphate kinase 1 [Winogradskyella sp.]|uniref:polyphosphate kinase 1 n=1 Tax=Winogradskyella sp. TaxID=1883156 RepID=UPI0026119B42|nr:polyphosphate kinase 1 [Winogradskyella sp.]
MAKKDYFNRDLSWLSFNERVLQEAEDKSNTLNERLNFLAIFSSNLDEFYRVRVSKLREFRKLQKDSSIRFKEKPKKIIKLIQAKVDKLQERFGHIYRNKLLKELNEEGVSLIEAVDYNTDEKEYSKNIFLSEIRPYVKIYDLAKETNFDFIKDKSLYFFVNTVDKALLIYIPTDSCNRFVEFPKQAKRQHITFLDEIIRDNIGYLLPGYNGKDLYSIKITRDGELYYEEEDGELINLIKKSLKDRDLGIPTRILYDSKMPKKFIKRLRELLNLKKTDLMPGARYHNFSDFFQFPNIQQRIGGNTNEDQIPHHVLHNVDSVIDSIVEEDHLLSLPYQKYDPVIRLIEEASQRTDVHSVFITLYRVSKTSLVAHNLLKCLANNKKVTVFIEAKARFDEENNIDWGEKLQQMGAKVLYSMPDLKVHSKILLIKTTSKDVAYIGTGNFNEKSAKIYSDFALLTTDQNITKDLDEVFKFLLDTTYKPLPKTIWMSPFSTRNELYQRIDNEIQITEKGGNGFLFFKMNSLEDKGIIDKLYEASKAGVKVQLLVRGICCLKPGVEGLSENIKVISIVGKYLEHARVYVFGNNGTNDMFIGSADCMERNLERRVEVLVPIKAHKLKKIIDTCINLQWYDNTKARIIDENQSNEYQKDGKSRINSQLDFKEYLGELQLIKKEPLNLS